MAQFLTHHAVEGVPVTRGISVVLVVCGIFVVLAGTGRYFRGVKRIDAAAFRPAGSSVAIAAALMVITGAMSIVFILLLTR